MPLGFFRSFKVCSYAKERVWCGKQRETTAHIQSLVNLQPWFLSLQWKTCIWAELQPRFLRLQWRTYPWVEHSMMIYIIKYCDTNYKSVYLFIFFAETNDLFRYTRPNNKHDWSRFVNIVIFMETAAVIPDSSKTWLRAKIIKFVPSRRMLHG